MKTAIIAVLLLVSISSFAADFTFDPPKSDWSSSDTYRELGFQGLWLIDALQTHQIVKSRQATTLLVCAPFAPRRRALCQPTVSYTTYSYGLLEQNHFLGEHPTMGAVNRYFLAGSALHAGVSYLLPETITLPFGLGEMHVRKDWQYATIGLSGANDLHNFSLGIGVGF